MNHCRVSGVLPELGVVLPTRYFTCHSLPAPAPSVSFSAGITGRIKPAYMRPGHEPAPNMGLGYLSPLAGGLLERGTNCVSALFNCVFGFRDCVLWKFLKVVKGEYRGSNSEKEHG